MFDLFARKSAALITLISQETFAYQEDKLFQYYVCIKRNSESINRVITLKELQKDF